MKKLLFGVLTAFGVALGANAAIGTNETTFETDDTTVSVQEDKSLLTGTYWSVDGKEPGVATTSKVMAYEGSERSLKKTVNSDYGEVTDKGMTNEAGVNYLQIDADSVLLRNNKVTLDGSYYIDTMVKFTATDLSDKQMEEEIATGEKIVVWMYKGEADPAPVLKVAGGFVESITSGNSVSKKTYTAVGSYNEGTWYRLSVKAISDPFKSVSGVVSFVVCINGTPLTYVGYAIATSDISGSLVPKTEYRDFANNLIPSRVQGAGATELAGLGFKGNGAVDNILFSAAAPCNALKDGSKVVFFEVNGKSYVTFQEALTAALASETPATIKLADDLDFANMTAALSIDWSKVTPFEVATTVVLDLNGKTIPVLNETDGTSIDINGGQAKNGTIKIISSTGNAIVQGLVVATESEVIIGDANDTVDKGVTYAYADNGMFDGSGFTIKLYKGKFVKKPTAANVTPADGYELVKQGDYWTIAKVTLTEYDLTVTVVGEGVASVTVTTNSVVVQDFTSGTPIKVLQDAKVTITTTVADWYKAVAPQKFDMPAESKGVTISTTKIASSDIGDETPAADAGITEGDFTSANKENVQKVVDWAKANNVSLDDVKAMNFKSPGMKEEAYLLNCANTKEAIDAKKANFKITSFTLVDGKLTPTLPSGYNGTVREKGTDSISGNTINWTYVTPENRGQFKFIKAVLEAVLTK